MKGIIAPSKLGTVAKDNKDITGLVYYNDGGNYVLPYKTLADGTKVREDWNDIKTMPIADTSVEGGLAEKTMMLTVDNGELADDEEATVYFQMPAGTYSSASVTLFVEVYDENEDENVVKMLEAVPFVKNLDSDKNGEADKTAFYRGGTTAVFGVEDKELAAHEVTELDILSAQESGAYAASYEDLVEIIKNGNESTISNMGELKIDNAVIKLLKSTSAKGMRPFTFVNPVEIVSTTTSAIDLKDIILVKNATITDGKFVATEDLFAPTATGDTDRNITVASGAQLTVKASQSGVITNKSTVNVEGNLLAVKIKDAADAEKNIETTVSIKGKAYVGNKAATTSQNATAPATDPTIVLDGTPTTLKLNANVVSSKKVETEMYYTQLTIGYGQTLKVDEQVKLWYWTAETDELLKNNGTIENKGTIIGVANIGTWDAVNEAAQEALIENYGIIENLQNGGTTALPAAGTADTNLYEAEALVKQMSDAADIKTVAVLEKDKTVITHLGKVDNSIGAFISVPAADAAKIYVYASYTGNYSGKLGHAQGIDKIYGTTGTWTDIELPTTAELELTGITFAETDATASSRVTTLANPVIKIVNGTSANIMKFTGASASIKLSGNYKDIEVTAATELNLNSTTKVTGTLKSATLTTLNIADTELNNVNTSALATINVRPLYGYKADGTTINAVTAKTSKLIGALTVGSNVALNLYPDVTFRAENSASITAGYKLVSAAATVEHGTITGHTCEAGKVLDYANIID